MSYRDRPSSPLKGSSLVETIIASFILLTAMVLTVHLINSGFRTEADNKLKVISLNAIENVISQIRQDVRADFLSGPDALNGRTWPSPISGVQLQSSVQWRDLVVPCTELESQYPESLPLPDLAQKRLSRSVWEVTVTATHVSNGDVVASITTLLTDVHYEGFRLDILARTGLNAPENGELEFRAVATSQRGDPLDDLILTWYIEPINSFGSIQRLSRDGSECIYKNSYLDYGNRWTSTTGLCRIVARAEYKGNVQYAKKTINNE